MHGLFDKSGETAGRIYRRWGIGVFALPVLMVIALAGLALAPSDRLRDAVKAEFTGADFGPGIAPAQPSKPAFETRTVKAD